MHRIFRSLFIFSACLTLSIAFGQSKYRTPEFNSTADYVRASGKWLADHSEDAMKYDHVEEINCFKKANCIEAYAWVSNGKLDLGLRYYEITRWDRFGLEAQNTTPPCITSRIVVNFGDKSVKALDAPKPASMIPAASACSKEVELDHTKSFTLVSSQE